LTSPNDNLSADLSLTTLQSVFGSALTSGNVNVGVVGVDSVNGLLWESAGRASGPYTPAYTSANSTTPGTPTGGQFAVAESAVGGLNIDPVAGGPNGYTKTQNDSWSFLIAQKPGAKSDSTAYGTEGANSFAANLTNPMATMASDGSGGYAVNLDLYGDNNNNANGRKFLYDGYFNLDINGSSLSLTYDPAVVPEPTTYGVFAGAGLLLFALRRQFVGKNA